MKPSYHPLQISDGYHDSEDNIESTSTLSRKLSVLDGWGIAVGIMVGSGIFSSPGIALERTGAPILALFAWGMAGLLVFFTSQCYIELGCAMPSAGGDFEYLRNVYGERAAFSFAWFNFFIAKPGSQAIIATIFGRYLSRLLGYFMQLPQIEYLGGEDMISKLCAVIIVLILLFVNYFGVKESSVVQLFLTISKLSLVVVMIIMSVFYCFSSKADLNDSLYHNFRNMSSLVAKDEHQYRWIWRFGSAMAACLFSFDGWADLNFMQEELVAPEKSLPKSVFAAIGTTTVLYLLINLCYLLVLPYETIVSSQAIAEEMGRAIDRLWPSLHGLFSVLFLGLVIFSTIGALNGSIMTGGRALYAVAREGKAPSSLSHLNSFGSPSIALFCQGMWCLLLLLLPGSTFGSLLDYFGPISWFFYGLTASTAMIWRRQSPHHNRPFQMYGYPWPPVIVVLIACGIVGSSIYNDPFYCLLSFGFVSLSIPVHYYYFER